jgi:acetoin utilization protein AcuB
VLVRDRMTPNPTTVRPESDPMAAQTLMRYGNFRRLPVVDHEGKLIGIVTASDLDIFFSRAPSPGVVKRQYRVDQVMHRPVITVSPDYPLEEAAQLMLKNKIGSVPVVEGEKVVGIITESDIFAQLVEALGGDTASLRITVDVPDRPGQFALVAAKMAELNYNICSVLSSRAGERMKLTMRIEGADLDRIIQAVEELDEIALTHIWQSNQPDEGDLEV